MTKTKNSLVLSVISLLLCLSMLLSTTFAWFTDVSTSKGNVVQSGSIKAEMYWSNDLLSVDSTEWKNADGVPVFKYDDWEPGYTDVKYIKVKNAGNLSFKWRISIEAVSEMTELADVIDVYYVNPVTEELTSVNGKTSAGTLSSVVDNRVTTYGELLPAGTYEDGYITGETVLAIALNMKDTVSDYYQNMSIGDGFELKLIATQLSYENDSFGNTYDENAKWPDNTTLGDKTATSPVTPTADNKVGAGGVSLSNSDNSISASVPEGVQLNAGVSDLTLNVKNVQNSSANITLGDNEEKLSLDVCIDGVAKSNEVVIKIFLAKALPIGLNIGNYRFYHVEDGATVEMTLLPDGATPSHNNFEYDPVTGDVVLYLKSFSEVDLIADTENAWNGTIDTSFAGGEGTEENPYLIANADQLAYLSEVISNDNENYAEKYYKLVTDINFGGTESVNKGYIFYPVGYHAVGGNIATVDVDDAPEFLYFNDNYDDSEYAANRSGASAISDSFNEDGVWYTYGGSFRGVFDGNGNTIKNIYQNTWQMRGNYDGHYYKEAMGIFGYVNGGTVKNLTVDSFSSDGEFTPTGVVAAYAANATFENIAIKNCNPRVYNTGNGGIVGVGGSSSDTNEKKLTFTNITVDNSNKISALWGSWDVACGGLMGMFRGNGLVHFENCHVGAQIDVYNDVCGNYQYYWYRYAGMVIGSIRGRNITDDKGYVVPDMTGITANDCTVHFGTWNDYYYCELVANSLASYTHDHQFSRLTEIKSLDEIKDGDAWTKTGNFLLIDGNVKTCYHIINKDGTLTQHLHTDSGEETVNGETVLKEDKQIVYLPFNQLFQGDGWGVKHIPVYNGEEYAFEGITILDRTEANSEDKFTAILNGASIETGTTITIGEIFEAIPGAKINLQTLKVFVSPADSSSTVTAVYTANTTDWTLGTLTFDGLGAVKIVITDYNYCKEATTSITIADHPNKDKFVANGNLTFTHTLQGGTIDKTLGDIFSAAEGVTINSANVVVTIDNETLCTYVKNESDWTQSTLAFTGTGSVVITITDENYCNVSTATVSIGHPENADKFTAKAPIVYTPKHDKETYTFTIGQLFNLNVDSSTIVTDVIVIVDGISYVLTGETWATQSITLTTYGAVTVTITDNNYCNEASNTVTFNEPITEAKFEYVGNDTYEGGETVALGDLFNLIEGKEIGNNVVVNINGTEVELAADSWQTYEVTFDVIGSFTVTIKEDSNYCTATTKTVTVKKIDKFTANNIGDQDAYTQITLGDLFATVNGVTLGNVTATVTAPDGTVTTITGTGADWSTKTIDLIKNGEWTVVIVDDAYSNEEETTFSVNVVDKFNKKFTNDYLYRVGNINTITIGTLFAEITTDIAVKEVSVTIETISGASGVFTPSTTWTAGTIQFTGTGVVKVTISAIGTNELSVILEVVEAKNATSAADLKAESNNVVLLQDVSSSGFSVNNGYSFYGNGFKVTCYGDGSYSSKLLTVGYVTVAGNSVLENVQIICDVYPESYLFTSEMTANDAGRYPYAHSAVTIEGNSTISGCYIFGARTNIFVKTGNVTIKNTVTENGSLANIHVAKSSDLYTVTFDNVTTIQNKTTSKYDTSKKVLGMGIIVGDNEVSSNPTIKLLGDLKQYNWVSSSDSDISNTYAKTALESALSVEDYQHTINGNTHVNLGIVYLNTLNCTILDQRDEGTPEYYKGNITIKVQGINATGQVYSIKAGSAIDASARFNATTDGILPYVAKENPIYTPQFKLNNSTLGNQYIANTDGCNSYCYVEGGVLKIMFESGDSTTLDLAAMISLIKYTGQNLSLTISVRDLAGNSITTIDNKLTLNVKNDYIITYSIVDNLFFDKNGNTVNESITYSWEVPLTVSLKDKSTPDAEISFVTSEQKVYNDSTKLIGQGDYVQMVQLLDGLRIYDYIGQNKYLRFNGTTDFNKIAKVSIGDTWTSGGKTLHTVTIELVDGGILYVDIQECSLQGGSSTHNGSIFVGDLDGDGSKNLVFANNGKTSQVGYTWYMPRYEFKGNNGVSVNASLSVFGSTDNYDKNATKPTTKFSTSISATVSFDANGGQCGQSVGYKTSNYTTLTLPTPSRSGYIFAGWYTSKTGGTKIGVAGDSYAPTSDITLYAIWSQPCTVTYDANGGSCDKTSEYYDGTALILPTPTRDGYWFVGWYDAATSGNKIGDADAEYHPMNEITLYAHWQEQIQYTVTYNANEGDCSTENATYEGSALTLPTATKVGSTFLGWFDAVSGGNKVGDAGGTFVPSSDITLYAHWEKIAYTITVTTTNATISNVSNGQTAYYGDTITVKVEFSASNSKSLTVKDASGNIILEKTAAGTYTFTMPASDVTINASSSSCVTADTLVTLADGTQKRIDQVTYDDQLLVWNFFTGEYATVSSAIIFDHGYDNNTIIKLNFSDGTSVKVVNIHQLFDADLNKFISITAGSVANYVGHKFAKSNGNGYDMVTLVDYTISEEYVEAWGIISSEHYNIFVEGMLSTDFMIEDYNLFNYFEIGDNMMFDEEKMQSDIETYGLYTYEDFAEYLTYEQFVAFNVQYFKIPVAKGLYTYQGIIELINKYLYAPTALMRL